MSLKGTISKKGIAFLNENELELRIIQHLNQKAKETTDANSFITTFSKGLQMFYSTWWFEAEINNGGFSQYFWNSASRFAKEAYYGYLSIGAKEYSKLVGEGISLYVKYYSLIRKLQEKGTIDAYKELEKLKIFDNLDTRFFDIEKKENTVKLRRLYINTHPEEFINE